MQNYYLAIDIGASNGRHILSTVVNGKIELEEIYRFPNGMSEVEGSLCWNLDNLFYHIICGMKQCKALGKIPKSIGIDTWGVDYVLLDKENQIIGKTYGYRDHRTQGIDKRVSELIDAEALYQRTGIQKQIFNTIYQLMSVKKDNAKHLEQAQSLLMIPDYFNFRLTGKKVVEYTNATTTQLVSPITKDWDYELINLLGLPQKLFTSISRPGSILGDLTQEIADAVGYQSRVVLPATHDTGSAVLAVPTNEKALYISSGTWSLMGVELFEANCSKESKEKNFTNEGGYEYRFRYLKNIMGLWMIQSVKREIGQELSYEEICTMASKETIASIVECNDESFLAPGSMVEAIKQYCVKTNQVVPKALGEIASVVYNSLAKCYADTVEEIEQLTGDTYNSIRVVGGGANADYLNRLTAKYTKRNVFAGPTEATAIGNLIVQMIISGEFSDLSEARTKIGESFDMKFYEKMEE